MQPGLTAEEGGWNEGGVCVLGWVSECDSGTDADLAEWLSSIGVDSDVADKVRPVWFEFYHMTVASPLNS